MEKAPRQMGIELLRIVATGMIVLHHLLAHGGLLVIALLLMLIPGAKIFGYTLCAGVVASAAAAPLMRLFQVCFLAISQKPALFGKAK